MLLNADGQCNLLTTVSSTPTAWSSNLDIQEIGDEGPCYYSFEQSFSIGEVKKNNPKHWFLNIIQNSKNKKIPAIETKNLILSQFQDESTQQTITKLQAEIAALKTLVNEMKTEHDNFMKSLQVQEVSVIESCKAGKRIWQQKKGKKCAECNNMTPSSRRKRCDNCHKACISKRNHKFYVKEEYI